MTCPTSLVFRCEEHDFWYDIDDDIYEADSPSQVKVWCPDGFGEEPCEITRFVVVPSGLDKTRLEAAAKALYAYRYNPSGWEKDDNPLRESLTNQAAAAIRAYLDHTEET